MRIVFASMIFLVLAACESESPAGSKEATPQVRPAKLIETKRIQTKVLLNYPAVIQAQQSSELAFQVGGVLTELPVTESQSVKKGQRLAVLDQRDFLAKFNSAKASFENAAAEYRRALNLLKENAISRSKAEQRKSQLEVSRAQYQTARKALEDTVLVAPFSGNIAKITVAKRQIIQPGNVVISIFGSQGREAKINLPSRIIALSARRKQKSQTAYVVLEVAPDRRIPATFKAAVLEADPVSQTYEIIFGFDVPKDLVVLPGMNATVWFKDPTQDSAATGQIRLPLTAIATAEGQTYVWVVDKNSMTVSKRQVVIEPGVGVDLNIIDGLSPGETIVAAGISYLYEGMQVRPWSK